MIRTVEAGQAKHAADVGYVPGPQRLHRRLGADVVLAVGQAETALQDESDVGLLAVDTLFHRHAQQVR